MLGLVLASLVSAKAPSVGLAVAVSVKLGEERQRNVVALLAQGLSEAGLPTRRLETRCAGEMECLVEAARAEGLDGAIFATLARGARDVVAVDLDAVRLDRGSSVAGLTFTLGVSLDASRRAKLAAFASQVLANVPAAEPPPPLPPDTPRVEAPKLEPTPDLARAPPPVEPAAPSRGPAYAFAGAGALCAVAAGAFAYWGSQLEAQANANLDGRSPHTRSQAQGLIDSANGRYTASAALGIAAGALVSAAVVSWLSAE